MTPAEFHNVYREMIDENPLAVRAVLKLLRVEFTTAVPTLAVSCRRQPVLLVNLEFVARHCRTDAEVKAVVCHEFLHVLLRHTDGFAARDRAEQLALDAVINAVIHRSLGDAYSGMMSRYYAAARGMARLLRPPTAAERSRISAAPSRRGARTAAHALLAAWGGLYDGRLVADDVRDLARDLFSAAERKVSLLGNHCAGAPQAPDAGQIDNDDGETGGTAVLGDALDKALAAMNGSGIFRSPRAHGVGAHAYRCRVPAADAAMERWKRETLAVLRRHLLPDRRAAARHCADSECLLPLLSPGDRRAAVRASWGWNPIFLVARWQAQGRARSGTAHVYLDASGSMDAEMPAIVALLGRLSAHIHRPFWAFSDVVAPARIEGGQLLADTTGGTSLACVLAHVIRTRPPAAVVITDGYVEPLDADATAEARRHTRLHALVTRDGRTELLRRAQIPCTQLSRLPS